MSFECVICFETFDQAFLNEQKCIDEICASSNPICIDCTQSIRGNKCPFCRRTTERFQHNIINNNFGYIDDLELILQAIQMIAIRESSVDGEITYSEPVFEQTSTQEQMPTGLIDSYQTHHETRFPEIMTYTITEQYH